LGKNVQDPLSELETRWREREREWARKLGRLRLGVEPLDEQLLRYQRVTWAIMIVVGIIVLMFLALFSVFERPDIGAMVVCLLFLPMIAFAWLGFRKLERRTAAYQAERAAYESERMRLMEAMEFRPARGPS
jgi:ABC-type transport system involved in cytochrome bd biosynthesis fused ATPase/permease subunit